MNGPGLATLPSITSSAGVVTFQILVVVAAAVTCFVLVRLIKVQWAVAASSSPVKNGAPSSDAGEVELENLLEGDYSGGSSPSKHKASSATFPRPKLEDTDIVALSDRILDQKKIAAWAMVGCALSLALAQMMLTAAIADAMIVVSMRGSCGISFFGMDCTSLISMKPFSASVNTSILSAGIVLPSSITVSLASVDLDSLLTAQYVLFGCLLLASARFCLTLQSMDGTPMVDIIKPGPTDNVEPILAPAWIGDRPFDAVGPILFNFAFVVTAPPLICGTSSPFRAMQPLVVASLLMGFLYIVVGTIGANAATGTEDNNLLSLVLQGKDPSTLQFGDVLAVMLFGLSQLATIPVYCELARDTLSTHLNVSNQRQAFFASHVGPWVVVALTYNSALFQAFVEWSSLLLLGFANFSMPLLLDHTHFQRALLAERGKLHIRHDTNCPGGVAWGLALITASIAAILLVAYEASSSLKSTAFYKLLQALVPGVQHASAPLQQEVQHEHVTSTSAQSASRNFHDGKLFGRSQTTGSISPINAFPLRYIVSSLERLPSSVGRAPSSKLSRISTRLSTAILPISDGMRFSKLLLASSSCTSDRHDPSSVGIVPGNIWKIKKPMLAADFQKKGHVIPESRLPEFLEAGYETYLPDDCEHGKADTQTLVEDFVMYQKAMERSPSQ